MTKKDVDGKAVLTTVGRGVNLEVALTKQGISRFQNLLAEVHLGLQSAFIESEASGEEKCAENEASSRDRVCDEQNMCQKPSLKPPGTCCEYLEKPLVGILPYKKLQI